MEEKNHDEDKRQTLKKIIFSVPAIILPLIPGGPVWGFDFEYEPYSRPDSSTVKDIIRKNDYPNSFDFCYRIPYNTDAQGNTAGGSVRVTKNPELTAVNIEIIHPHENKCVELVEKKGGGLFDYIEKETIFDKNGQGRINFMTHVQRPIEEAFRSPLSLVDMVFGGKIKDEKFSFYGERYFPREYKLDEKETKFSSGVEQVRTEIKENDPRFKGVTAFYKKVNGHKLPVEFHIRYEIKLPFAPSLFGLNMDEHTLKIILEDSA